MVARIELCHSQLDLPSHPPLFRFATQRIEVWDDELRDGEPPHVTLYFGNPPKGHEPLYLNLTPAEARALAAMLTMAANGQDIRADEPPKPVEAFSTEFTTEPLTPGEPLAPPPEAAE